MASTVPAEPDAAPGTGDGFGRWLPWVLLLSGLLLLSSALLLLG